ncbi:glycosyltransferase family 2 protein [Lutimonas zeaxanthinifaciens]|uniref:glycosyltransferase family 2 protein n=1 Tax=Lutimonas zeaxanthinifaciens TaxID=3060215 RepID=UPI00265C9265|nr:glycosyltransferase family 2 protein [Lutimonas sp. YSD2104]WKK67349.1 glycosyltransferase family 2 protein [Lutimonas sp. YSD2104]
MTINYNSEKNPNLVSVIIPTYNRAHLIGETLESIMNQTYENWECIVVDDGSTDNTKEVMKKYCSLDKRIKYFPRPTNRPKGGNGSRNYGFEISSGEFINWFDSDDLMHKDKLSLQVSSLIQSEYPFSVCNSLIFENSVDNIIGFRFDKISSSNPFSDYLRGDIGWLTTAPLWKKEFLNENDFKFDEKLLAAQEWEFHSKILHKFPDYDVINEGLVLLRRHNENISNNPSKKRIAKINYYYARKNIQNLMDRIEKNKFENYFKLFYANTYKYFLRSNNLKEAKIIIKNEIFGQKTMLFTIKFIFFSCIYLLTKRGGKYIVL